MPAPSRQPPQLIASNKIIGKLDERLEVEITDIFSYMTRARRNLFPNGE